MKGNQHKDDRAPARLAVAFFNLSPQHPIRVMLKAASRPMNEYKLIVPPKPMLSIQGPDNTNPNINTNINPNGNPGGSNEEHQTPQTHPRTESIGRTRPDSTNTN
jgi:hypothetical protein